MASGESKGSRRYDKENLLWQSTVAIKSDPVALRDNSNWANDELDVATGRSPVCLRANVMRLRGWGWNSPHQPAYAIDIDRRGDRPRESLIFQCFRDIGPATAPILASLPASYQSRPPKRIHIRFIFL